MAKPESFIEWHAFRPSAPLNELITMQTGINSVRQVVDDGQLPLSSDIWRNIYSVNVIY
jgi:hypothetical protein